MKKLPDIYNCLEFARSADVYHPDMDMHEVINTYFPKSIQAFVQDMSDITAAFYGTMLSKARLFWGSVAVDTLAMATITDLGHFKAQQTLARYPELPKDARGLLLILIASIFSANPEFKFRIIEFTQERARFNIMGKDRYYRIAVNKGIQELITWPPISHFLRGANAELGWDYGVDVNILRADHDGGCLYDFVISRQEKDAGQVASPMAFLQMPEGDKIETYGQLAYVPLGKLQQYVGAGFTDLFRKALSLEAYNYYRQEGKGNAAYILAESMSARRRSSIDPDKNCYAVIKSRGQSGKKRQVTIGVLDEHSTEVYDFTFDYHLWEKSAFEKKFDFLRTKAEHYSGNDTGLPEIARLQENSNYSFRSSLPAFGITLCADHYPGFPCVPAIYIYKSLMKDTASWLRMQVGQDADHAVEDFVELVPVKMIPVDMDLIVDTRIMALSKKRFRFVHEIRDSSGQEIHLIVLADISIP